MATTTQPTSAAESAHVRRQTIVQTLLSDVFEGRLRAGQHLVTQSLAERFGVSHTPVREALLELSGMGVVELLPHRGAIVSQTTARSVRDVNQVRRLLECEAARKAAGRTDPHELRLLAAEFERLKRTEAHEAASYVEQAKQADSRLHDLIAQSCGNSFLAGELNRLKVLFRTFRDVFYTQHLASGSLTRLNEEAFEHLAITQALAAGEPRAAAKAMNDHLRSGARYYARTLLQPLN
jgi:DNA-binding GntR family transcriptional regulator